VAAGRRIWLGFCPGSMSRPSTLTSAVARGRSWARSRSTDVIDAALALLAQDGDEILTSDPDDLRVLVAASGVHADVVEV
jgi:hypothetical protein